VSILDDQRGQSLIKALLYNSIGDLVPKIGIKVSYPSAELVLRANREATIEVIQRLWEEGYLSRSFHGVAYRCPRDGTTSLRPKLLCPKCMSEDIEKVTLIEHLGHGHVDRESKFLKGGKYVCPVDGKELKLIGVDYRKPGTAYYCPTCDALYTQPLSLWACNQSDHNFAPEEAIAERTHTYQLNTEKIEELRGRFEKEAVNVNAFEKIEKFLETSTPEKATTDYMGPIVASLKEKGWEVDVFKSVTGRSGVPYVIDINAWKETLGFNFLIRVLKGPAINVDEVFRFYAVGLDVPKALPVLVVIPKLEGESSMYARKLGLKVIEADSPESVSTKLNFQFGIEALLG
jgi:hypothetical protein